MNFWLLFLLSFGHMITDVSNGAVPAMMLYMRDEFALTYTQAGTIILVASLSSSVIQPLFGLYSDKASIPWLMPLGIGMATLGLSLAGVMPSYYLVLAAIFFCGLGVAAFHPEGSKTVNFAAGSRKSSAMSLFSVGGNLGFGLGPVLGALFISAWGLAGSLAFLGPGLITAIAFFFLQSRVMAATREAREVWRQGKECSLLNGTGKPVFSRGLFFLIMVVLFRSLIQFGLITYMPFYYTDYLGGDIKIAAMLVAVFLISGAVGTLFGGPLADKFGAKKLICCSMALMFPLLVIFLNSGGITVLLVTALAGMVLISTFGPTVVMAQQYLPHHIGLASGLSIGLAIGIGGMGVPLLGIFADRYGVDLVLTAITCLPLIGLSLALFLPKPPESGQIEFRQFAAENRVASHE